MTPDKILLVDDDPGTIQVLGKVLAHLGDVRFAVNGDQALRVAQEFQPDLLLLDAEMPGMTGFDVCVALKNNALLADVPVIFVTSHSDPDFELRAFDMGAAYFIAKPISAPLVLARARTQLRMKKMADELRRISATDALTGVANRRRFDDVLSHEWRRSTRDGESLSLLMVDVDHFKLFNDRYGHPAGDACLRSVAQALVSGCQRPADLVTRYGGEEFAVLLPATSPEGAALVARRLLEAVEALAIAHEASPGSGRVTVSVGISSYRHEDPVARSIGATAGQPGMAADAYRADDLVRAADVGLYAAKTAGRAQVRFHAIGERSANAATPALLV